MFKVVCIRLLVQKIGRTGRFRRGGNAGVTSSEFCPGFWFRERRVGDGGDGMVCPAREWVCAVNYDVVETGVIHCRQKDRCLR